MDITNIPGIRGFKNYQQAKGIQQEAQRLENEANEKIKAQQDRANQALSDYGNSKKRFPTWFIRHFAR